MTRTRIAVAAAATLYIAVTGCSSDNTTPGTAVTSGTATAAPLSLGVAHEFVRADNGAPIGTITVLEAVALPAECSQDPIPAGEQMIVVRTEITNGPALALPGPDYSTVTTVDSGGYTQPTASAFLTSACKRPYPDAAHAGPGTKTIGWEPLRVHTPATAIVYSPIIATGDVTNLEDLGNLEFIQPRPTSVTVKLPSPLPTTPAGA